jgi:hypothetical protein
MLAYGDMYQMPPAGQTMIASPVHDNYAQLHKSGSLWQCNFETVGITGVFKKLGKKRDFVSRKNE